MEGDETIGNNLVNDGRSTCVVISEDAGDDSAVTDAAENRLFNLRAEYDAIVANVSVVRGPRQRFTVRDQEGHVVKSFHSEQEAHAWVLNECPNWRERFRRTSRPSSLHQ